VQVKVTAEMKVYHVPGFKKGLDIMNMEGEVKGNVVDYKGVQLSPNYPWKVAFSVQQENGKTRNFFVHLVRALASSCPLTCCGAHFQPP
jgi:hypothetical protein